MPGYFSLWLRTIDSPRFIWWLQEPQKPRTFHESIHLNSWTKRHSTKRKDGGGCTDPSEDTFKTSHLHLSRWNIVSQIRNAEK